MQQTELELKIAERFGRKHALIVGRGTTAIYLILKALGLSKKRIIIPDTTCLAVANAVIYSGNVPVFCDVSLKDCNVDVDSIKRVYTPDVKAIIAAHMYGNILAIDEIKTFCAENNVAFIEDAALALGASLQGRPAGSFGDFSIFSFGYAKIIDCGFGGAVLTDDTEAYREMAGLYGAMPPMDDATLKRDDEFRQFCRLLNRFAKGNQRLYVLYPLLSQIYRETYLFSLPPNYVGDIVAAINSLQSNVESRHFKARIYADILSGQDGVRMLSAIEGSVVWRFSFFLESNRDKIVEKARLAGFDISTWYPALHKMHRSLSETPDGNFPNSTYIEDHIINLWVDNTISKERVGVLGEWLRDKISRF